MTSDREDERGRVEAEGRVLVAGADRERERDHRARAAATTRSGRRRRAARVTRRGPPRQNTSTVIDREERQPVLSALPRQAPEDRPLAVVELAQHEREIERDRETADVDDHEREHAREAAESPRSWSDDGRTRPRRMSPASSPEPAPTRGLVATSAAIVLGYACASVRPRSAALLLVLATALPRLAALLHERGVDRRRERREGRRLRPDLPRARDVRLHPGSSVCVHAAALRLVPPASLLDLRAPLGGRRARADRRRRACTTLVVWQIGRRWLTPGAGLVAGLLVALHPYLVWHDVHMNREILDHLLAACIVYLTLHCAERSTPAARARTRRRARARDPRQRPARGPAVPAARLSRRGAGSLTAASAPLAVLAAGGDRSSCRG